MENNIFQAFKGIDLMLTIDAEPQVNIMGSELEEKIKKLRNSNVAISVLGPEELENKWRKLSCSLIQ